MNKDETDLLKMLVGSVSNQSGSGISDEFHEEFKNFKLDQIKINCAGCDKFFHCKIAGTCYGDNCASETRAGRLHRLSWCINCVSNIPENREKTNRTEACICNECQPK